MAFIDELMKLQGNQMGGTPVANPMMAPQPILMQPPQVAPQATPQAPQLTPEQRARVEGSRASSEQPIESNIFKGAGGAALGGLGRATGATALGESMGEYYGAQKYGTGIAADGSLTGQPRTPNTLAGQGLTLAATGLEYLGDATTGAKTTAGGIATGLGHVGEYLTGADLVEGGVVKTPTAPTQQAAPEPSVFQHTNAPLPSASIGQVSAPSPFEQPPTQNPMLTPQIEQEYAPQRPDVIAGTPFPSAPAPSLAQQLPESGTEQFLDPQGRLRRRDIGTGELTEQYSEYEKQAAAREKRAAEQFGVARGPDARDRDAGEMSAADARDMDKLRDPNATEGEKARAMQVAERLGRDPMTGAPVKTGQEGMTPYQRAQVELQKAGLGLKMTEAEAKAAGVSQKQYDKMAKAAGALQSLEADLNLVREKGEDIKDLTMKPRTEGLLAKALAKISPTSTAAQLERASGTLTGDAFIKGMRVIKEFGGGLGSVTEVEGMKVERAQGAIFEPGMDDAERRNAVDNYLEVREDAYNRIRTAFVDEFGEEQANRYLGGGSGRVATASSGATQVPTVEGVTIEEIN